MAIVKISGLTKEYAMGKGNVVKALGGVDISIEKGEFLSIMGPSGSGKSTLLNMLGCLDTPTAGTVVIDGENIGAMRKQDLPAVRNRKIGFVFQQHHLLPALSSLENVMLPLKYSGVSKGEAKRRAEAMLREVGLGDRMHHRATEMSGGQQQRVAIARALVTNPSLVLADEPTGALDTATGDQILALMKRMNETRGITFAIVTHNPEVAEACGRVIVLRDGLVKSDTTPAAAAPADAPRSTEPESKHHRAGKVAMRPQPQAS